MRMRLLLVLVLCPGLEFSVLARVELPEGFKSRRGFCFLVPDELAVAKGDVGQDLVDLFLAVVEIHVLCADLVLFLLVADDPVAACWVKAYLFCDFGEDVVVDHH